MAAAARGSEILSTDKISVNATEQHRLATSILMSELISLNREYPKSLGIENEEQRRNIESRIYITISSLNDVKKDTKLDSKGVKAVDALFDLLSKIGSKNYKLKIKILEYLAYALKTDTDRKELRIILFEAFKKHIIEFSQPENFCGFDDPDLEMHKITSLMISLVSLAPEILSKRMVNEVIFLILDELRIHNREFIDCFLQFFQRAVNTDPSIWANLEPQQEIISRLKACYSRLTEKYKVLRESLMLQMMFAETEVTLVRSANFDCLLIAIGDAGINEFTRRNYIEAFLIRCQMNPKAEDLTRIAGAAIAVFIGFIAKKQLSIRTREMALDALILLVENNPSYYETVRHIYAEIESLSGDHQYIKSFLYEMSMMLGFAARSIVGIKRLEFAYNNGWPLIKEDFKAIKTLINNLRTESDIVLQLEMLDVLERVVIANQLASQEQLKSILEEFEVLFINEKDSAYKERILKHAIFLIDRNPALKSQLENFIMAGCYFLQHLDFAKAVDVSLATEIINFFTTCAKNSISVASDMLDKYNFAETLVKLSELPIEHQLRKAFEALKEYLQDICQKFENSLAEVLAIPSTATLAELMLILKWNTYWLDVKAYNELCESFGLNAEAQEKYLDDRKTLALERLYKLIKDNDYAKQTFIHDLDGLRQLCELLATNLRDEASENILKILNYLVAQNPETHHRIQRAGIASSVLNGFSQKINITAISKQAKELPSPMAILARQLLNHKVAYFTDGLTNAAMDDTQRVERINALESLCMFYHKERTFFASVGVVLAILTCAFDPKNSVKVRAAALNTFTVIENDLEHHYQVLEVYQADLRRLAAGDDLNLRDAATRLLGLFDKGFTELRALYTKILSDVDQAVAVENINKIPDLMVLVSDEKREASVKIFALKTLNLFARHSENLAQMQRLVPILTSISNNTHGLLVDEAEALLNILTKPARDKAMYCRPFYESMGDLYEGLSMAGIKQELELPFNNILTTAVIMPAKVKEPIGAVGSIERRVYDLLESLNEAIVLQEGIEIIEQFTIMACTENGAREALQMQDIKGVLDSFVQRFEGTLTVEADSTILMLRGLTEHVSTLFYKKAEQTNESNAATLFSRVKSTTLVASALIH